MIDDSYLGALERSPERHEVLLGPVPCKGCGAWIEWAGVEWLGLASTERHDCMPYRQAAKLRQVRPTIGVRQAHPIGEMPDVTRSEQRAIYLGLVLLAIGVMAVVLLWPAS